MRLARFARIGVPVLALGVIAAIQSVYFQRGLIPGDAFTYLAAGERLNAGHALYALVPGDRPVDLNPPFWTVPLLSPPPIAVVFRPLALLGDAGAYVWWLLCLAVIGATGIALLRRQPVIIGLATLVLSIPVVYEIGVGNLNGVVVGGLVLGWVLLVRGRDDLAGVVLALVTALKLTPAIFLWWLVVRGRWRAARWFLAAGIAALAVSVLGAGIGAHLEYLSIIRNTATVGTSNLSIAGLARTVGVPESVASILPYLALSIGLLAIWVLRGRPGPSWAATVVTMLAASPVVNVNWFTLLLAALAPLCWPPSGRRDVPSYRPGRTSNDPSLSR
jgi:alpha-1,2-mannosyltransferase